MSSFTITETAHGTAQLLACQGRLDNNAAGILEARTTLLLENGGKHLVLDFAGVDYLSSAGLRSLLVVLKKTKVAGCTLDLCEVQRGVLEVLALSGFGKILNLHANRAAALAVT